MRRALFLALLLAACLWGGPQGSSYACAGTPLATGGTFPCDGATGGGGFSTTYTLSGPATAIIGTVTSNFTVVGNVSGSCTITPADASNGGTFTPSAVTITGNSPATFTYTAVKVLSSVNITTTNGCGLTNPSAAVLSTATNLATSYPGFTAGWSTVNASLATGLSGDPFAGSHAASITENTAAGFHAIDTTSAFAVTASKTYTVTAIVKAETGTRNVLIIFADSTATNQMGAIFSPSSCAFVANSGTHVTPASTKTIALGSGWCLIQAVGSIGAYTSAIMDIFEFNGTTGSYTGDGTSSVLVYGAAIQ